MMQLSPLNPEGWAINSSFSNQTLYGFVAHISNIKQLSELVSAVYPVDSLGIQELLQKLTCLQCRSVLLEWWLSSRSRY